MDSGEAQVTKLFPLSPLICTDIVLPLVLRTSPFAKNNDLNGLFQTAWRNAAAYRKRHF